MNGLATESSHSVDLDSLLDESGFSEMSLPSFWSTLERDQGEQLYPNILYHLTRMDFPPSQAKAHWERILLHLGHMSRVMGRDVALRTAMCDYFLSLAPMLDNPVLVESLLLARSERFALMDELTGLHNRRFFNRELHKEMERVRRTGGHFSLLMLDVDHFKDFNDLNGHMAGDAALSAIAHILDTTARQEDHVARYGGEEFAIILPRASRREALATAERHRYAVECNTFVTPGGTPVRLTVSIGSATYPEDADNEADLVSKSDHALYRAKRMGRNRVCGETQDMRVHARFPLRIPATCTLDEYRGRDPLTGRTVNISLSGMLLETNQPIDVGHMVHAQLSNPRNGGTLPLDATTVRLAVDMESRDRFLVAMAFTPRPDEQALIGLMSRQSPCPS